MLLIDNLFILFNRMIHSFSFWKRCSLHSLLVSEVVIKT